jgi:redox-sensitive bicupin YhaK (pirin superfamily)
MYLTCRYGGKVESISDSQRQVLQVLGGQPTTDGAGVKLTRVIGSNQCPQIDPFLLLDEFCSDESADYIGGFPNHPHRGFETVSIMLDGAMRHEDSLGNSGHLRAGSVQWMTAGKGIVHSEMPEQVDGLLRGFQIWVNLPASEKMCEPRYQDIEPSEVPTIVDQKATIRVVAGTVKGVVGPVNGVSTEPLLLDLKFSGQGTTSFETPPSHAAFVYCYDGTLRVGEKSLSAGELGVLSKGAQLTIGSDLNGCGIFCAGKPLNEPISRWGPFVMNTDEEIRQAVSDYRSGKIGR